MGEIDQDEAAKRAKERADEKAEVIVHKEHVQVNCLQNAATLVGPFRVLRDIPLTRALSEKMLVFVSRFCCACECSLIRCTARTHLVSFCLLFETAGEREVGSGK